MSSINCVSTNDFRHLRNLVYLIYGERRLTRGMVQKLKGQNAVSLSRESPSRNSIIVINDSDNETRDNETNGKDKEEDASSLSIIECSPTMPSSSRKSKKKESQNSLRQNKNRSLISLSNLSIIESSSTQSQCNGENIGKLIFLFRKILIEEFLSLDTILQ